MTDSNKTLTLANFTDIQEFQTSKGTSFDPVTGIITFSEDTSTEETRSKEEVAQAENNAETSSQDALVNSLENSGQFLSNEIGQAFTALDARNHSTAYSLMATGDEFLSNSDLDQLSMFTNNTI